MIAKKTQKVMWIHFLSVVFPAIAVVVSRGIFNSLLEAYLTPGEKKNTSGYRTRRSRRHCLKSLIIATTEKEYFGFKRIILRNRGDFKDQLF